VSIEQRKAKILINKAGGTAGADAKNYRVALPSAWINELGIDEESREVVLQFDGESITIRRAVSGGYSDFVDTVGTDMSCLSCIFTMVTHCVRKSAQTEQRARWQSRTIRQMYCGQHLVSTRTRPGTICRSF